MIEYKLEYKRVKNINLRIKSDGSVCVSASRAVPKRMIDEFVMSKADFIERARKRLSDKTDVPKTQYFSHDEIRQVVLSVCERVYPYFKAKGVECPQIKFRKMVSQWGNCHSKKGVLTFNTNLVYVPLPCIEYVVIHEFSHFLVPNHSKRFYNEVEKLCPDWKNIRKFMRGINLRQ